MTSRRFIGRNEAEVREIINLIEYYRRRSEGGVCIREYEELLPDTEERYFVYRGRAWSRDSAIPTIVEEVADRMDSPFYSVDIVLTGLSGCSAVDPFYQLPGSGFRGYLSTGCYSAGPRRGRLNSTIPQRIQPMKKVAIIQESPCILDKKGTLEKAVDLINNASANGAELIVFPEAFVPGYPAWIWRLRPGSDWSVCEELHARLLNNSIDLSSDDLDQLLDAAGRNGVTVVCGVNERDSANSQSTLFNSVVTIDHHGKIVNHHRKLMPTNPERMVWGLGDGHGLNVVDTPVGRTGSLICWENYMPLARYALYSQGVQVYIAPTYDSGEGWKGTMQHIAREGKCWVLSCGVALERKDLPADFPEIDRLYPPDEEWINPGDSLVVSPAGEIVSGPCHREKTTLFAEIDVDQAVTARRALDVAGHYSRPDVLPWKSINHVSLR